MERTPRGRPPAGVLAGWLRPLVDLLDRAIKVETARDPFYRDPAFVARVLPLFRLLNGYFGTEFRGWENVPLRGPFLIAANHSGGAAPNDFWFLLAKWAAERGPEAPLYALAYHLLFAHRGVGTVLGRLGVVPATRANARRALATGAALLVFPGGDYEVFRPWRERNRIDFGGHTGFVKLALETGVPVVPMTIHGAHQSTFVLTRGRFIAQLLGIDRLHVNVFPFIWNLPLGVAPAFVPSVQLPAKVTIMMRRPLDWAGRSSSDDVIQQCYDEITRIMQADMEALARERPHPVASRLRELVPVCLPATFTTRRRRRGRRARRPAPWSSPRGGGRSRTTMRPR